MKALKFLGVSLIVAGALCFFGALASVVVQVWQPHFLEYGVTNPMYTLWSNLVVTLFVAAIAFGVLGCFAMAVHSSHSRDP